MPGQDGPETGPDERSEWWWVQPLFLTVAAMPAVLVADLFLCFELWLGDCPSHDEDCTGPPTAAAETRALIGPFVVLGTLASFVGLWVAAHAPHAAVPRRKRLVYAVFAALQFLLVVTALAG